ncbi:MAG TPA: hypothetical protein DEA47_02435 [Peptococcaceae bacterium]|nr:MAG: Putative FAD and NAD-binding oxidoreductase [Clostridia bacterium 41_269]HBT20218.1 hypothetical protein [Peptococcaceae bacterium]
MLQKENEISVLIENSRLLSPNGMNEFIRKLSAYYEVYAPIKGEKLVVFEKVENPQDIAWDYETTQISPKKFLHKPFEILFSFEDGGKIINENKDVVEKSQILLGLHPCDVRAIEILDKVFTKRYEDPYYMKRRKNSIIIALTCSDAHEACYCTSFGTGPRIDSGFDLLITTLGGNYLVEIGSARGREILSRYADALSTDSSILMEYHRLKNAKLEIIENKISSKMDTEDIAELLEQNINHPLWENLKEECLACGSCTIVCPTCYCFTIIDKVDLTLKSGERQRVWDSCMLLEFAEVALGVNFRSERAARIKQRVYHKLYSFEHQYYIRGCVGCGRCIRFCLKKIDPRKIIAELRGEPIEQ